MGRGKWLIDDFDLSGIAWNVSSRAAGWSVAGARGGNVITPGVDGERHVPNKALEASRVRLSMWAVGSNPDGSMPSALSRQNLCRANLERIAAILGDRSQAHDLVRVESAGYGTVNLFPNPRSEDGVPGATGYRQQLTNPSQRVQASSDVRRNEFPDPNLVQRGTPATAVNLYPDPFARRYKTVSPPQLYANHWAYTSYEASQGVDGGGASAPSWDTASNVSATVVPYSPSMRGTQALMLRATSNLGTNTSLGKRTDAAFPQGARLSFRCKIRRRLSTTRTQQVQARAVWFDGSGNQISTSAWSPAQDVPQGQVWGDLALSPAVAGVSPSTRASVEIRTVQTIPDGDGYLIDAVGMMDGGLRTDEAAPFFDGDDPWAEWNSNAGRSRAWVSGDVDPQWTTSGDAFYALAVSSPASSNTDAIGFTAHRAAVPGGGGGQQRFLRTLPTPETGRAYSLRILAQGLTGTTSVVELGTVVNGVFTARSTISVIGTSPPSFWTESTGLDGVAKEYVGQQYTAQAGDVLALRVTLPVQGTGNQILQLQGVLVGDHDAIRAGSSPSTTFATYAWSGTPMQSPTIISRPTSPRVLTRHAVDPIGTVPALGAYVRTVVEGAALLFAPVTVTAAMRSSGIAALAQVRSQNRYGVNQAQTQPQVRWKITALDGSGTVIQTWLSTLISLPLGQTPGSFGGFVPVHVPVFDLPAGAVQWQARLEVYNAQVGQYFQAQKILLSDHAVPVDAVWFDGKTTGVFVGDVDNSPSLLRSSAPVGWSVARGILGVQPVGSSTITSDSLGTANPSIDVAVAGLSGTYRLGFEVATTVAGAVRVQALSGDTLVGQALLGRTVGGALNLLDRMQGLIVAGGSFDRLRVTIEPTSTPTVTSSIRLGVGYLIGLGESRLPALDGNLIPNPVGLAGILGWLSPTETPTTVVTTVVRGRMFTTSAGKLTSDRPFPVLPGQALWTWARVLTDVPATILVRWYNAADELVSSTSADADDASARDRVLAGFVTAPAGTVGARIEVRNTSGTGSLSVLGVYATPSVGNRDYSRNVDPTLWLGFDGSSEADSTGTAVQWDGTPDASTSSTKPYLPVGWDPNGLVRLQKTLLQPPGSRGRVVAFPGFENAVTPIVGPVGQFGGFLQGFGPGQAVDLPSLPDQTLVGRTVAVAVPKVFTSGEVAVARDSPSSYVTVRVFGCDDQARTNPTLQFEKRVGALAEIVTWRDLGIGQPWCYVEVEYVETEANPGYALTVDNVMVLNTDERLVSDYPGYFDGASPSAIWLGTPDQSASKNYAGARHTLVEFTDAIDIDSMAGATRADFDTVGTALSGVWEDMAESVVEVDISDPDVTVTLDAFAESSARNTSAVVTISLTAGTAPEILVLTDARSQSWVQIGYQLQAGEVITVDSSTGSVTVLQDEEENSLAPVVSRGGTSRLLVLTPFPGGAAPALEVAAADAFDGILHVEVRGRRKYVIA